MNIRHPYYILCALFSCLITPMCARALPGEPIRIGYVTDLTGRGAFFGTQSVRGVRLALSEIPGLKVIVEDSGGESSRALTAATKLLDFDKVDAVMCDLTPICTPIVGKVSAANKPLIYLSPATSLAKRYAYAYRNFIDYFEGCRVLAQDWKQRSLGEVATLVPNMEFGDLCAQGFDSVFKGHRSIRYNPGDDLRTPMLSLRAAGIKGVLHVGYEPDFLNWFKLCHEQRFRPIQGFMEVMLSKAVRAVIGDEIVHAELIGYEALPSEFIERLDRIAPLEGGDFNRQGAAMAFNGIKMLARAFDACVEHADTACLDRSLRSAPMAGLLMGFRGWKDENAPYPVTLKKEKA